MTFFMTKTISKTFRISPGVAKEIEKQAKKRKLTQGEFLMWILYENRRLKMEKDFERDLMVMEKDAEYLKEERDLADSNFL